MNLWRLLHVALLVIVPRDAQLQIFCQMHANRVQRQRNLWCRTQWVQCLSEANYQPSNGRS